MMNETKNLGKEDVALIGLPFDGHSSFMAGPALAPDKIREALDSDSSNLYSEDIVDLISSDKFKDLGNILNINHPKDIIEPINEIIQTGARCIFLGGDHSLTYGTVKAISAHTEKFTILHLDAHPDLYDELDGNKYSHACPFARIMEEGLADRLVQVGIRTLNSHQKEQALKYGVEIIEMRNWSENVAIDLDGPVYLSLDIDVLDPAFAPGISHHEPGGCSTRHLINFLQQQRMDLISADIVEYNPKRDINGMTAMVCAKLLKEILAKF